MAKAAIATLDMIFAVAVASVVLLSLSAAPPEKYHSIATGRTANDVLTVLDKQSILETVDKTKINNSLQALLPRNLDAQLVIKCYNYCSDVGRNCTPEFYLNNTLTVTSFSSVNNGDVVTAKRFFITNSTIPLYCISLLGVQTR